MIMQARHHLYGSGFVPHIISMTKRWGPVGSMRVGGMGLRGLGQQPSPVGFADFASYQAAVIASQPPCPPPYDPACENPRDATIANALAQWTLNPRSCHNVVCDSVGNPVVTPPPDGTGSGFQTGPGFVPQHFGAAGAIAPITRTAAGGFVPISSILPSHTRLPWQPIIPPPAAPQQPNIVNPSPSTQLTTTGSSTTAPGSVVSQTNGTAITPGTTASTVGGTVLTATDTSGDLIAGVPNWILFVGGGLLVFFLAKVK